MQIDFVHLAILYAALFAGVLYLFFKPTKLDEQIHVKQRDPLQDR
ncbi:MAG: hypothetical protein H6R18_1238 [Proteobacteria bacterium]|nr:hypothetical protein [Pseudomonadota bacterium]